MPLLSLYRDHMIPMTPILHQEEAKEKQTSVGLPKSSDYKFGGRDKFFFKETTQDTQLV